MENTSSRERSNSHLAENENNDNETKPDNITDLDEACKEKEKEASQEVDLEMDAEKKLFEDFFKYMQKFREGSWSVMKLESNSPNNLAPILREMKHVLERGGAKDSDHVERMIAAIIEAAQQARNKDVFWEKVSDLSKMSPESVLRDFYDTFTAGLNKQAEKNEDLLKAA